MLVNFLSLMEFFLSFIKIKGTKGWHIMTCSLALMESGSFTYKNAMMPTEVIKGRKI